MFSSAEAAAEIIEAPELHINEGSTMRLECKLKRATESPLYVFWWVSWYFNTDDFRLFFKLQKWTNNSSIFHRYHDARMVNYDSDDGVSVTSNRHKSSILTVQNATIRHGGNYTCAPANAKPTSISVHVLKGKNGWITNAFPATSLHYYAILIQGTYGKHCLASSWNEGMKWMNEWRECNWGMLTTRNGIRINFKRRVKQTKEWRASSTPFACRICQ